MNFVTFNYSKPRIICTFPPKTDLDCVERNCVHEKVRSVSGLSTGETNAQILSVGTRTNVHIALVVSGRPIAPAVRDGSVKNFIGAQESLD
jgi:hypothetical protein